MLAPASRMPGGPGGGSPKVPSAPRRTSPQLALPKRRGCASIRCTNRIARRTSERANPERSGDAKPTGPPPAVVGRVAEEEAQVDASASPALASSFAGPVRRRRRHQHPGDGAAGPPGSTRWSPTPARRTGADLIVPCAAPCGQLGAPSHPLASPGPAVPACPRCARPRQPDAVLGREVRLEKVPACPGVCDPGSLTQSSAGRYGWRWCHPVPARDLDRHAAGALGWTRS
jgi:hypothetical protein